MGDSSVIPELQRQVHLAINKLGYGLGRPVVDGNSLHYDTPDPEDAAMIAEDVPALLLRAGIKATVKTAGRAMIVTVVGDAGRGATCVDNGDRLQYQMTTVARV